jgi:hypothetical protein
MNTRSLTTIIIIDYNSHEKGREGEREVIK